METRESHKPQTVTSVPPRRPFFRWVTAGLATVAAAVVGAPVIAYILRTRKTPVQWIDLGTVSDFPENETRRMTFDNPIRQPWDGIVAHAAVYVRNEGKDQSGNAQFLVLGVNCAHLGCPVSWFPESALFMCPCHGGVYYSDGSRAPVLRRADCFDARGASATRSSRFKRPPLSDPARHVGATGLIGPLTCEGKRNALLASACRMDRSTARS